MNTPRLTLVAVLASLVLTTSGCIIHVNGHGSTYDKSSVFGGFDIPENSQVGDLSSINGGILLQSGVTANEVSTVNGSINIGSSATLADVSTVNGNIEADQNVIISGDVSTVNGTIEFERDSQISRDVSTVNGDITLVSTNVGGDIETTHGDVSLSNQTHVSGDIVFRSINEKGWWNESKSESSSPLPTLSIDHLSSVEGKIILERKVKLNIENPALLEKVVERFNK